MQIFRRSALIALVFTLVACSHAPAESEPSGDLAIFWVKNAAEFRALSLQAYASAERHLDEFIADTSWSALPDQDDAAHLPPAVILDVDETVVSNVDFQKVLVPPFAPSKLDAWYLENEAFEIPGVSSFVAKAQAAGVEVFFVTNRPCEPTGQFPCSQRQTTLKSLSEIGIQSDAEHVLMAKERGWDREKVTRRQHIAQNYRVIMLFGDDLGDFIPCVRKKPHAPCTEPATRESRKAATEAHKAYWGHGWYILPNPMHGSFTSWE
jgi:acid phosphatase